MATDSNIVSQLFSAYDEKIDDANFIEGNERFEPNLFKRTYTVFKLAHLTTRIVDLSNPKIQLPLNSIAHLFDDIEFNNDEHSDTPRLDLYPIIQRESSRRFIYHVRAPDVDSEIKLEDTYIYKIAGLPSNLMQFRADYGNIYKPCNSLDRIQMSPATLTLINHNPIFRMKLFGRRTIFRKTELALTSILNTAIKIARAYPDKRQYLFIPWTDETFERPLFLKSKKDLSFNSVKRPDSVQYTLMMHILNYVAHDAVTSIFDQVPEELRDKINLAIFNKNKFIIYNLAELKNLSKVTPSVYLKVCNQLNTMGVISRIDENSSESDKKLAENHLESMKNDLGNSLDRNSTISDDKKDANDTFTEIDVKDKIVKEPVKEKEEDEEVVVANVKNNQVVQVNEEEDAADDAIDESKNKSALTTEEKIEAVISHLSRKILPSISKHQTVRGIANNTETPIKQKEIEEPDEATTQTEIKEVHAKEENYTAEYNLIKDKEADDFLDNLDDITPKQKMRFKVISRKYKDLELNGVKLNKILNQPHDIEIDTKEFGENVIGKDPVDDSIRNSKLNDFDKSFLKKTYNKQLVSILTSFRANGLYLTDLKVNKVQTPLNSDLIYTCKYTNVDNKQFQIKLKIPTVDAEGRIIVDGIHKVMKKQRIDLPIVKISDTEVSLSSNYNKYRVIKNTTKAHDYFTFIENMIDNGRANVNIIYGNNDINLPISYDYVALAKHWGEVSFKSPVTNLECNLIFNYSTRFTNAPVKEAELGKLEKHYGVYFGTYGNDLLFINKNNKVYGVRASGGEDVDFKLHTMEDIFRTSLLPEAVYKKQATEWTTLKILDATLPIIFILAYRYGLRRTLDHLHLKYAVTERRNKNILGAGESFGVNSDNTINGDGYGYHWIKRGGEDVPAGSVTPVEENDLYDNWQNHDKDWSADDLWIEGTEALNEDAKYKPKSGDIAIKFADRVLWFNRYPLKHSLIVAGLDAFDLSEYNLADFESKDVYYKILVDMGKSINYLKGIDSFFDLFMDPITFNVLRAMGEPTNTQDLLIRATELLTTPDYRSPSSNLNHRIRGYEQMTALIYNEVSRELANYQSARGKNKSLNVNPESVYLRIVTNASLVPSEAANPLQSIKESAEITHAGSGGRTEESFVVNDRRYTKDDIGVMAIDTVDNGKVGMAAMFTYNPGVLNTEGLTKPKEMSKLTPADVLSLPSLLMPSATHDDPARINFVGHQITHMLPTKHVDRWRVRTGYERVVGQLAGRDYSGIAAQDGVVTAIDEKSKICKVKYKDGSEDIFTYGDKYTFHESVAITQSFTLKVKVGQKLKQGDVIYYNNKFFYEDPTTGQIDFSIGLKAKVALIESDVDLEDATEISERLAEKLSINPANERVITIPRSAMIHMCKKVGDEVNAADPLIIFEDNGDMDVDGSFNRADEDTLALLKTINRKTPKARFAGKIVKILAYYGGPIEEMSASLQPIVRTAANEQNKLYRAAKGTEREMDYLPSEPLPKYSKYKGIDFDETTVMLIFYIEESNKAVVGDKVVLCNQLKNTISNVATHPRFTEEGEEIDAVFSCESMLRRIVTSMLVTGVSTQIMEKMEGDIVDMYFGKGTYKKEE